MTLEQIYTGRRGGRFAILATGQPIESGDIEVGKAADYWVANVTNAEIGKKCRHDEVIIRLEMDK